MTSEQTRDEIKKLIESISSNASNERSKDICERIVAEKLKERIQNVLGKQA